MTTCKGPGCGAEILFVPSAKSGRPMILDARPEKRVLVIGPDLQNLGGLLSLMGSPVSVDEPKALVVDTYVDHHATCPAFTAGWRPGG